MTDQPTPPDEATPPDQWEAIARFLAGEGSAGDSADIRQWLIEHPDDAHVVASLEQMLPPAAHETLGGSAAAAGTLAFGRPIDVEGALRRVHAQMQTAARGAALSSVEGVAVADGDVQRIAAGQSARTVQHGSSRASRAPAAAAVSRKPWWKNNLVAAAAVLVAAVGLIQGRSRPAAAIPTVAVTHTSAVGSSDSVTLADGSQVILAAGSRLVVSANYGQGAREVELQGAARFTVTHDEARPFSVRMGHAVVRDLGTVFTVKTAGSSVIVAVTEGSVNLSDSSAARRGQAVDLKAGDRGELLADGSVVAERGIVTPDESAWVTGKLLYRDAPMAEVQSDLRRWYGVELVVTDNTLKGRSVNTDAVLSEPVSKVVERLELSLGAVATTRGDTIFLDPSGARIKR